jgi:4-amino-4-deoxy-L-arabinose transferase-like glycosyltransferase
VQEATRADQGTRAPSLFDRFPSAFYWWMAAVCACGLGIRLVYVFVTKSGAALQGDAFYYHYQAQLNLKGHWFVDPSVFFSKHPVAALIPSAQHPPLFTLFLTFGDLFGLKTTNDQLVLVCLVGTATILLTGLVTRDLVTPRAGVIAAVVAALYPGFWVFDGEVMSEALVMLLAALTILAANRCFRQCTTGRVVVLGLLTGLCALTRAEMVLLVPLVALPTVLWQRTMAMRRRLALCVLAVAVAVAPMVPWFARNAVVFHHPVTLSDQFPITVAAANNAQTYHGPLTASWCFTCLLSARFPASDDESDEAIYWQHQAEQYIKAHKVRALEVAIDRVGLEWSFSAPSLHADQDFLEGWPVPVSDAWLFWYYPLIVLGVAGAVILRRRRQPIYPLIAMFVVTTFTAFVTYGNYRFRSESEVAIVVLAAVSLDALWSLLAGRSGAPSQRTPRHRLVDPDLAGNTLEGVR